MRTDAVHRREGQPHVHSVKGSGRGARTYREHGQAQSGFPRPMDRTHGPAEYSRGQRITHVFLRHAWKAGVARQEASDGSVVRLGWLSASSQRPCMSHSPADTHACQTACVAELRRASVQPRRFLCLSPGMQAPEHSSVQACKHLIIREGEVGVLRLHGTQCPNVPEPIVHEPAQECVWSHLPVVIALSVPLSLLQADQAAQ